MKTCRICRETKPVEAFHYDYNYKDGRKSMCATCRNRVDGKQRPWSPLSNRNRLLKRFGLTDAQYEALLADHAGLCGVCGQPERARGNNGELKALALDHDHTTGKVRGLLCHRCNTGLGGLGDDIELLRRAIAYLERHAPESA